MNSAAISTLLWQSFTALGILKHLGFCCCCYQPLLQGWQALEGFDIGAGDRRQFHRIGNKAGGNRRVHRISKAEVAE